MKVQTLKNGWKDLLDNEDADLDSEGLKVTDYCRTVQNMGGEEVAEEVILQWLEHEGDPKYHITTESEIADEVTSLENEDKTEDNEEEETMRKKLSVIRSHLYLITFIDNSSDNKIQLYYTYFCNINELIIKNNNSRLQKFKQNDSFFQNRLT